MFSKLMPFKDHNPKMDERKKFILPRFEPWSPSRIKRAMAKSAIL
jgi:hypothetical protein